MNAADPVIRYFNTQIGAAIRAGDHAKVAILRLERELHRDRRRSRGDS